MADVEQTARDNISKMRLAEAESYLRGMINVNPGSAASNKLRGILYELDPIKYKDIGKPKTKKRSIDDVERLSTVVREAPEFSGFPYKVPATKRFIQALIGHNEGSYEDYMRQAEEDPGSVDPDKHIVPIAQRASTRITVYNDEELAILYTALGSSRWGNTRQANKANEIMDEIRDYVAKIDSYAVKAFPQARAED